MIFYLYCVLGMHCEDNRDKFFTNPESTFKTTFILYIANQGGSAADTMEKSLTRSGSCPCIISK